MQEGELHLFKPVRAGQMQGRSMQLYFYSIHAGHHLHALLLLGSARKGERGIAAW